MSNPQVACQPQWWAGPEHKPAICACIKSSEEAPADKIEALTEALLEHMMSPMSAAGSDGDVIGAADTEATDGQLDLEDENAALPT